MPHRPPADERSVIRHRGETAPNTLRSSPQIRFTLAPMSFRGAGSAGKFTQPAQAWLRVTRHMPETPYIRRRDFLALLAATAAWPRGARAQQPGKTYRVGLLSNGPGAPERRTTLLSGLAARGFVDGKNLVVVPRSADARPERLDGLAAELKAENVDAIVTFGYPAALAAKKSTKEVP